MHPPPKPVAINYRYLVPICLVAALGGLLFGYDTGVISGAIEPLTARFALSALMKGWVSGCVLIGCAAGVLFVGGLSDRLGRRLPLFLSAAMFFASALGTALPSEVWVFILFRFLGGVGIGIASIATPMYIAEIAPAQVRGRLVAVNQIAIVCGIAATSFVNYFIAGRGDQAWLIETGWRWMFATGVAPSLVFALLLFRIPESPRWLIEMRREEEARTILGRVGGPAFCDSAFAEIKETISRDLEGHVSLLSPQLRRPLLIGIALAILQQVTGINVFMYFGATIFRSLSASTGVDAGLLQQVIINGACVVFTLVAIASVDRWGRRPLMLLGTAGMGAALFAMGSMAQWVADPASTGSWMLVFILVYIAAFGLSVGPVTWVILAEIFPTTVRGRALGLATFFLWTSDYLVTQTFPIMDAGGSWFVRHFHHAFPFYTYTAFCVVLLGVVSRFVPETKGRTLEQIERDWNR
jgi:sugar porter (SP) family MFS transporter